MFQISGELIIQITDENDNPPVFKNALYTTDILENDRDNTYLLSITATDIDISKKYATIKYYIDDKQCPFSINPRTGIFQNKNIKLLCRIFHIKILVSNSFNHIYT